MVDFNRKESYNVQDLVEIIETVLIGPLLGIDVQLHTFVGFQRFICDAADQL